MASGGGSGDEALPVEDFENPTENVASDCPMNNHLAADANGIRRRGVAVPDRYSFLEARPGGCHPVRFNPCEPIHYVVNARLAPPGAVDDLEPVFAQLSAATGMTFVNDGPTDDRRRQPGLLTSRRGTASGGRRSWSRGITAPGSAWRRPTPAVGGPSTLGAST